MVVVEEVPTEGEGPAFMNIYPTKTGTRQRRNVRHTEEPADEDEDSYEDDAEDEPESELSFDEKVRKERERFQATPMEKCMAMAKSLILRALVIYFIMTFLRGSSSTKPTKSTSGAGEAGADSSNSDDAGMLKYISNTVTQAELWKDQRRYWETKTNRQNSKFPPLKIVPGFFCHLWVVLFGPFLLIDFI